MAAGVPAARVCAGPESGGGHLVAAQAVHGQLRRGRPGRPGPHRQAQAEEDPVPAPPGRRLPGRYRPQTRALVTTCTTSSTWLAVLAGICAGGRPQGRSLPRFVDMDVKAFFDSVSWDLALKAVARHTDQKWVLLYVERWLKAPMLMPDGTLTERTRGTPQGGPISPLLANLFLHYGFDRWLSLEYPGDRKSTR